MKVKINQVTDQHKESTIGQGKQNEKVLFFADPHFLFLIPDAHLAHCLLPSNTQTKEKGKSQRAKLPKHLNNSLISKDVFYLIKGNKLVTL
jgi:hypothetical protein